MLAKTLGYPWQLTDSPLIPDTYSLNSETQQSLTKYQDCPAL